MKRLNSASYKLLLLNLTYYRPRYVIIKFKSSSYFLQKREMQHKDFETILQEGEKLLACFESDLTKDGLFGCSFLIITDKRIVVSDADLNIKTSVSLSDIASVKIEDYVGNAELKVTLKDGSTVSLIRFSRSLRQKFGDATRLIENLTLLRKVEVEQFFEGVGEEKPRFKTGPILYILKFVTPYKLLLTVGILTGILSIFLGLLPPYFMKMLIDDVILGHKEGLLSQVIIAIILTQAVSSLLGVVRSYCLSYVSLKAMYDMRVKMFNHIMSFQPSILDTYEAGRLISRITDDVSRVNWFLSWGLEQLLRSIVSLASVSVMIFILEPRLSLIALIPIPILGLGVFLFNKKSRWVYHYEWKRWADVSALLVDVIPGFPTVKSHVMEKAEEEKLKLKLSDVIVAGLRSTKLNLQFFPMLGFVMSAGTAIIWWIGGYEVLGGTLTLGTLSAFISYVSQFYSPIWNLVSMVEPMKRASTAGERIQSIMNMEPKIKDAPDSIDLKIKGSIVFDNVSFGYMPYMYVLKNVSFEIKPGEKIGIVGPTGGGKTTIVKLLMRFYDPDEGRILIDGVDIRKIRLESLRRQIGIVSQEPRLFNDTIANNIRYGKPYASPEEIIAAAKIAAAHDFIIQKPLGYDMPCGEGGSMLSGGEKQRIAIARAIISNPRILILDEATSNVDTITEDYIKKALDEISAGRTTIIIAHRLSTVKDADRLIVVDNGRIVEVGTHEELLRKNGLYAKLWNTQFLEKPVEVRA